ncbi:MAG TPA: hypothetical protein VKA46_18670 [Gemmataceae bacterium]|nr:hypothetical protein [Gemmataceae bacterium]
MSLHLNAGRGRAGKLLGIVLLAGLGLLGIANRCPTQSDGVTPFPPAYYVIPNGNNVLMFVNPTDSNVLVRLRSFPWGRNILVPAHGWWAISAPNANYEVFFRFGNDPANVYQGDSITLWNTRARITLSQSPNGNYGLRPLR